MVEAVADEVQCAGGVVGGHNAQWPTFHVEVVVVGATKQDQEEVQMVTEQGTEQQAEPHVISLQAWEGATEDRKHS